MGEGLGISFGGVCLGGGERMKREVSPEENVWFGDGGVGSEECDYGVGVGG